MDNEYLYDLVQFTTAKKKIKEIECVPSFWVIYDKNAKKCITKYPPPPYKPKNMENFHKMIQNRDKPNDDWPPFYVTVKGQARSYEEGLKKLAQLETEHHAFSNSDVPSAEQTARIEQEKRQEQLKKEAESLTVQMQLSMKSSQIADYDGLSENEHEDSSDDEQHNNLTSNKRKPSAKSTRPIKKFKINTDNKSSQVFNDLLNNRREDDNEQSNNNFNNSNINNKTLENDPNLSLSLKRIDTVQEFNVRNYSDHLVNREEFSLYQKSTNTKLDEILSNQNRIIALLNSFNNTKEATAVVSFTDKYNIKFPFETKVQFDDFDGRLGTEPTFRSDFISLLNFWYSPTINTISKQLIYLFKKILIKDVAWQYTGVRKSGTKTIIKDFKLIECLNEVFKANNFGNLAEILQAVGVILSNSKDWDGSRKTKE